MRARQVDPVRGRPGHAARHRSRHLPVRHLVERLDRRRLHGPRHRPARHRRGARRRQGLHDARRRGAAADRTDGEMGNRLRDSGNEYGAVTGRPRRCGWYDAVAVRYGVRINGLDALALTKLDVLDGLERIEVCTAYRCGGRTLTEFPSDIGQLAACEPVYESLPGLVDADQGHPPLRGSAGERAPLRRPSRRDVRRSRRHRLDRLGARRHHRQRGARWHWKFDDLDWMIGDLVIEIAVDVIESIQLTRLPITQLPITQLRNSMSCRVSARPPGVGIQELDAGAIAGAAVWRDLERGPGDRRHCSRIDP